MLEHACRALGWGLAQVITLVAPEVIVVGGSGLYLRALLDSTLARCRRPPGSTARQSVNVPPVSIRIRQNGLKEIVLTSSEDFARLKPLDQIEGHSTAQDKLATVSSGRDPNFLLEVKAAAEPFDWGSVVVGCILICTVILLVYSATHHLGFAFCYIPVLLFAVFLFTVTMALIVFVVFTVFMTDARVVLYFWTRPIRMLEVFVTLACRTKIRS